MIIRCGVNGEVLHENQICVCHHCGMPTCEQHGWVVASDDAFAGPAAAPPAPPGPAARLFSTLVERAVALAGGTPSPPPRAPRRPFGMRSRGDMTVPRPAMHCRDCVEKFHKGAMKRHGWAILQPVVTGFTARVRQP